MRPETVLPNLKPLFLDGSGRLVLGKANTLFRRAEDGSLERLVTLPESCKKRLLATSRWASRLARLGFGAGAFFQGLYFFSYGAKLYSYSPERELLRCELSFRVGRGPLSFTVVEGIQGFDDGIYFGEYFGNRQREPVHVYKRCEDASWKVVYSFAQGEINHIHGLVPDPQRNCIWLLAGDYEHSASIWMVKESFNEVVPILRGEQAYRACVAFPTEQGLLYATDTQITRNAIRLLTCHDGEWLSEPLFDINGSCIYGCQLRDYFVFSTATEPSDQKSNRFLSLLDRQPGPGIIENKSDVLLVSKTDLSCRVLFSKDKDFLPYRLFQFGAILFPQGIARDNTLFAYSVGNRVNDLSTEVYRLGYK
ncbi:hypothetical protein [Pseudomonas veronii]